MDECLERKTNCQALILRGYTSGYKRTTRFREVRNEFPRKTPIRVSRSRCKLRGASGTREEVKPKGNEFRTDAVKARPFYEQGRSKIPRVSPFVAARRLSAIPFTPPSRKSSFIVSDGISPRKVAAFLFLVKAWPHRSSPPPLLSVQRLRNRARKEKPSNPFILEFSKTGRIIFVEARAKTFSFFGVSPRPKDERADQVQVPNWRDTPWTSLDLGEEKHRPVDNASNLHPMDRYSALPGPPATVIQVSGSPSSRHRGEDDVSTREILLLCTPTLFLSLSISLSRARSRW